MINQYKILGGPILGVLVYFLLFHQTTNFDMAITGAIAVWMATWWITEAISLYFTAFLPIILFPFFGVISMKDLAPAYMPEIIFFFIGGFLLAFAMEKWDLHHKIAAKLMQLVGESPQKLVFGFMLVSYLLSMWILNTAVVMMLLPASMAIANRMTTKISEKFSTALLLGIAYAASIGGTATLVGTAPNLYFSDFFNTNFPNLEPITFASWFLVGLPSSLVFFYFAYQFLTWKYLRHFSQNEDEFEEGEEANDTLNQPLSYEQVVLGIIFCLTVILWFTANDLDIGTFHFSGWTNIFPKPDFIKESTVAMFAAFLLFIIPAKNQKGNILDWNAAKKIPTGVIFLFGGGFAIAKVIGTSGLSDWLGESLHFVADYPPILVVISLAVFMTFFTELTSNTASTVLILPILMALSVNVDIHPMLLMMPVVLSASYAFMLPVATPPNTIVFATEKIKMNDMVWTGLVLNVAGIVISTFFVLVCGKWVYGL